MKALKISSLVIAISLGSLSVAAVAFAHGHGPRGAHFIKRVDANNNGEVTKAEMRASVDERFNKTDKNKDNLVTPEEMKAAFETMRAGHQGNGKPKGEGKGPAAEGRGPKGEHRARGGHGAHMLAKVDTNKDGKVSRVEAHTASDAFFQKLDQDKNQIITKEELREGRRGHDCGEKKPRGEGSGGQKKPGSKAPAPKTK